MRRNPLPERARLRVASQIGRRRARIVQCRRVVRVVREHFSGGLEHLFPPLRRPVGICEVEPGLPVPGMSVEIRTVVLGRSCGVVGGEEQVCQRPSRRRVGRVRRDLFLQARLSVSDRGGYVFGARFYGIGRTGSGVRYCRG